MTANTNQASGKIVEIIGAVVDVNLSVNAVPKIYDALRSRG